MSSFLVLNFHELILFIWIVPILTLSTSDAIKTDGNAFPSSKLNVSASIPSNNETQTLYSAIRTTSKPLDPTNVLNRHVSPLIAGEGGPISIVSNTQDYSTNISNVGTQNEENIQNTENRKSAKIVSRKGANEMLDPNQGIVATTEVTSSSDAKPVVESTSTASNEKHKVNTTTVNSTLKSTNVSRESIVSTTVASSTQEHRPKPTATVVGPNSDKRAFIPHTKGSHLGISRKIDYVLPVIVTLVSLPVLGGIIFMLYKQCRDCWDKRHYRRMDFLIDGMYND